MVFRSDVHGLAFKCDDLKISKETSTWAMKLSQLARQGGTVYILTFSLPNLAAIQTTLSKHPSNMYLICNTKFADRAHELARMYPDIKIGVRPDMHSKVILVQPKTVYVSSANFGDSGWHETSVGIHSEQAYNYYVEEFHRLWGHSQRIQ